MNKRCVAIFSALAAVICLLGGCDYITGVASEDSPVATGQDTPVATSDAPAETMKALPTQTSKRHHDTTIPFSLIMESPRILAGNGSVSFTGPSPLPEGTIVVAEFYRNNLRVTAWPDNSEFSVSNGMLEISGPLGKTGPSGEVLPDSVYFLEVWLKDDPSQIGVASFDTIFLGPFTPSKD